MRYGKKIFSCLLILNIFLLFMSVPIFSAPEISRPLLRIGSSPKLKAFSPASFSCLVSNPDSVPHEISIRITPKNNYFGAAALNVYTDTFQVPAGSTYEYGTVLIIENTEEYSLTCFSDGVRMSKLEEGTIIKLASPKSSNLGILNDSSDTGFGSIVDIPELKDRYNICFFTSSTFPSSSALFEKFAAIVILEPDWERLSLAQMQTLFDYVTKGGTVIFGAPKSALKAKNTPVAQLLPALPCAIRKIDRLASEGCSKLFPGFKGIAERTDFLESVPEKNAIVYAENNGMPFLAMKKFGLGSVRFVATPLSESAFTDKSDWTNFVKFMLSQQELFSEQKEFSGVLDEMTGFSVPKTSLVVKFVLAYLIAVSGLLVVGKILKRQALAWLASVIISVLFSIMIISKAGSSVKDKGGIVSGIELCVHGELSESVTSYYGLFSSKNEVLTVRAPGVSSLISAIMPQDSMVSPFGIAGGGEPGGGKSLLGTNQYASQPIQRKDDGTPQLIVQRNNGTQELSNMSLSALRGRQFKNSFATGKVVYGHAFERPEIVYGASGFELKKWKIPDGISAETAFVAFPNGAVQVESAGGFLSYSRSASENAFSTDILTKKAIEAVIFGARHPNPALVVMQKLDQTSVSISEPFKCQGRKFHLFPLDEDFSGDEVLLGPQQVVFVAGDGSSRNFISGNRLVGNRDSMLSVNEIFIEFQIPPSFKTFELVEATVVFKYDNPGANILAKPYLLSSPSAHISSAEPENKSANNGKAKKPEKSQSLGVHMAPLTRIAGRPDSKGGFVFSDAKTAKVLDPVSGCGRLLIEAVEKSHIMDPLQKRKANMWSINELSISLKLKKMKSEEEPNDQD